MAALTIDRLQQELKEKCATVTEQDGERKATDDEGREEDWHVKLKRELKQKDCLSTDDTAVEETQETEKRSQDQESGFQQPENMVPEQDADKESRESSQQVIQDAERLANEVNEALWEQERLLHDFEKNITQEGHVTEEKKAERKMLERNEL